MNEQISTLENLAEKHSTEIPVPYIEAFTAHPWHEGFNCSCGAGPYSLGCKESMLKEPASKSSARFECSEYATGKLFPLNFHEPGVCVSCGRDLRRTLQPVFTPENVESDFSKAIKKQDFFGVGHRAFNRLIAFLWGYKFPADAAHLNSSGGGIQFKSNGELIRKMGIDLNKIFYHTEAVTLPEAQFLGLGTSLVEEMLRNMPDTYSFVAFRTINQAMVRCYEKAVKSVFGKSISLKSAFDDADTKKRQQWYVVSV